MRWPLLAASVLLLTGCLGGRASRRPPPPAAFDPAAFPDIPIAPGYAPDPTADLLAISMGGGALRRYHAVFALADERSVVADNDLLAWYRPRLTAQGWHAIELRSRRGEWRNEAGERLTIETGRAQGRSIMRILLRSGQD